MISNANYAKFRPSEDLNLSESEIEEKNVFNNLLTENLFIPKTWLKFLNII